MEVAASEKKKSVSQVWQRKGASHSRQRDRTALVEAARGRGIEHVTCGEGKVHAWRRNSGVSPGEPIR